MTPAELLSPDLRTVLRRLKLSRMTDTLGAVRTGTTAENAAPELPAARARRRGLPP